MAEFSRTADYGVGTEFDVGKGPAQDQAGITELVLQVAQLDRVLKSGIEERPRRIGFEQRKVARAGLVQAGQQGVASAQHRSGAEDQLGALGASPQLARR